MHMQQEGGNRKIMKENLIPWGISALLLLFSILTYTRNGRKDKKTEEKEDNSKMDAIKESLLKVDLKLDQVGATTTETRTDIKSLNKDLQGLGTRVSVLESDMKSAFRQIDELKKH